VRAIAIVSAVLALVVCSSGVSARAAYVNFESSHVHPIDLTPSGTRLLAVNTPDALLEVFAVAADGTLTSQRAIPVGLEPVTVVARTDAEAWVVNSLSDTVSIVDLDLIKAVKAIRDRKERERKAKGPIIAGPIASPGERPPPP